MSRRRELEQHLRQLAEIGEIMRSMKNLALMETRKLARFLDAQGQSVRCIEDAASDFLSSYPQLAPEPEQATQAILVIGSERGFCGDFNEELLAELTVSPDRGGPVLGIGHKLCTRLEKHPRSVALHDGPTVAEEVPEILSRLLVEIGTLQKRHVHLSVTVLYHRNGDIGLCRKALLPPFVKPKTESPNFATPPLLNLAPERFFAELVEHYLFAALHEILYTSLMAENHQRIEHLEGAIRRLDEKNEALTRQCRALRQEEITEEIEVILLSLDGVGS